MVYMSNVHGVQMMEDGECIVMVHVHCPCQKVRGENNVGRNSQLGTTIKNVEDQRSKCARLLTKFQKGDAEGWRDHFHFDQEFSSKTQKNQN